MKPLPTNSTVNSDAARLFNGAVALVDVPAGEYVATLSKIDEVLSRSGTAGLRLKFIIDDGEYSGQIVYDNHWLSTDAAPYTKRTLAKFGVTQYEQHKNVGNYRCRIHVATIGERHADRPLMEHIKVYIEYLKLRNVHPDRVKNTETRLREAAKACGFKFLRDLSIDKLSEWLAGQVSGKRKMSASVYNGYVQQWVSFGNWLAGKRLQGRRSNALGEKRTLRNPFEGMGKLDEKADPKRKARALTEDELSRLIVAAKSRPLDDALTVRRGPNKGKRLAKLSDEYRAELIELGNERALIYKTAILTGLRLNELRTLKVADLSFGDVPFIRLVAANEKNRKGSTLPLRSDLAAELKLWVAHKERDDVVFTVPSALLKILNRDLIAAGIPKRDADGCVVHVHALRHSYGTHLSLAGVAPRTAQAAMRHSNISLTMNTYTDPRLLETAEAIEKLTVLRQSDTNTLSLLSSKQHAPNLVHANDLTMNESQTESGDGLNQEKAGAELNQHAPGHAPTPGIRGEFQSLPGRNFGKPHAGSRYKKTPFSQGKTGFSDVGATRLH